MKRILRPVGQAVTAALALEATKAVPRIVIRIGAKAWVKPELVQAVERWDDDVFVYVEGRSEIRIENVGKNIAETDAWIAKLVADINAALQ